jgi:SAM-dependent methyltransferase
MKVNNQLKESYSEQYSSESTLWRMIGARKKVQNIFDITEGFKFEKILEIGAGDGSILQLLDENNFGIELHALEISESGLQKIQSKQIKRLKTANIFNGYNLPFEDRSFDLIILSHVLEHVEHERILLREINRVAKHLLIEVPKDYRYGADKKIKHFLSYGHINLYTPTSLKFLLEVENFKVLREQNRLYHFDVYLFNKKSLLSKTKATITYFIKQLITHTPFDYINHKFINTITLLVKSENSELKIF